MAAEQRERRLLSSLSVGQRGVIAGLAQGTTRDDVLQRVMALGIVPGTAVEVIRRAPFGDPTEYALRGYRLCLRTSEASRVEVWLGAGEGEA
jgi:ferrous iron transport protein A